MHIFSDRVELRAQRAAACFQARGETLNPGRSGHPASRFGPLLLHLAEVVFTEGASHTRDNSKLEKTMQV